MIVGVPGVPIGSVSDQTLRSKFFDGGTPGTRPASVGRPTVPVSAADESCADESIGGGADESLGDESSLAGELSRGGGALSFPTMAPPSSPGGDDAGLEAEPEQAAQRAAARSAKPGKR